jgi:hypothetical protein
MYLKQRAWKGKEWIPPAQDKGKWPALLNTVMSLCIP